MVVVVGEEFGDVTDLVPVSYTESYVFFCVYRSSFGVHAIVIEGIRESRHTQRVMFIAVGDA